MAVGFPTKANWAAGDVLTASQMDDLAGTLNTLSPVGQANGSTLVANSANASGLGWNQNFAAGKNKIINGDFGVWQRGTSFTPTGATTYTVDRGACYFNGTGSVTVSRQSFTPGTAPVTGYEYLYFYRYAQTTAGTGQTYGAVYYQPIEGVNTFAGQTVTVSFWAKADSSRSYPVYLDQNFGSGGSAVVSTTVGTAALTTSWQRFTFTVALPSITGKTIGTNSALNFYINISANNAVQTFDLFGVQLEAGSVATAFQTATGTLQGELALCQRYFYATTGLSSNPISQASYYSTTAAYCLVPLPVTMRTTPSATFQAATNYTIYANSTNKVGSAIALDSPVSTTIATVVLTTAAATAGFAGWLASASGSANGYIQLSAEL